MGLIIAIVLLIAIFFGVFGYRLNPLYQTFGGFVAAIAALVLFLIAIHVIHL